MDNIAVLLLAAGASSRMAGQDKLIQRIDGKPLLARICQRADNTGLPCYVTLPSKTHPRAAHIGAAQIVPVPDTAEGMAASIRAGVTALPDAIDAVMILPCDMPDLQTEDLLNLARRFHGPDSPVLRATTSTGTPGHPVLFPRRSFAGLRQITGDQGARALLRQETVQHVALPGQRAVTDLDTPEAWAKWRAAQRQAQPEI
ncbi:nucleotidyltransferase family protein [Pseudophaeobacter profundi]|uniref:nucleotidyltransferase family protein n=1 Tax=Pseudophaeobacter profundi TaxID=3034152 RepID=UPI00243004CF|nr:nucleotidyltransferase family protein [Pseudophaeobacter profundi]